MVRRKNRRRRKNTQSRSTGSHTEVYVNQAVLESLRAQRERQEKRGAENTGGTKSSTKSPSIPGYRYDSKTKKYYKLLPEERKINNLAISPPPSVSHSSNVNKLLHIRECNGTRSFDKEVVFKTVKET